jgi:uncharacterized membrane protein YeaQ/YmgE (transglycosylase-associated protein family)
MIGENFTAFLVLLVLGLIAAVVIHYLIGYRCLKGFDGFLGQWFTGWLGAWLGTPVLGHWLAHFQLAGICLIPGLIGAFAGAFIATAASKVIRNTLPSASG